MNKKNKTLTIDFDKMEATLTEIRPDTPKEIQNKIKKNISTFNLETY